MYNFDKKYYFEIFSQVRLIPHGILLEVFTWKMHKKNISFVLGEVKQEKFVLFGP